VQDLKELLKRRVALDAEIALARAATKATGVAHVHALMAQLEVSASDLEPTSLREELALMKPKYRDAETGKTWTGLGKPPKWLAEKIRAGASLEDYAVK
jgi:DNA-binding protein H-NS